MDEIPLDSTHSIYMQVLWLGVLCRYSELSPTNLCALLLSSTTKTMDTMNDLSVMVLSSCLMKVIIACRFLQGGTDLSSEVLLCEYGGGPGSTRCKSICTREA